MHQIFPTTLRPRPDDDNNKWQSLHFYCNNVSQNRSKEDLQSIGKFRLCFLGQNFLVKGGFLQFVITLCKSNLNIVLVARSHTLLLSNGLLHRKSNATVKSNITIK